MSSARARRRRSRAELINAATRSSLEGLVVEVETPATRRFDRFLKPSLYAEAGIPSYWRVEPGRATPLLRTYELDGAAYRAVHSIEGAEPVKLDAPYPLRVAPAAWLSS